jgi:DNA-binding LacI/PurR family transcriptional regulator/anti-anti-sigma regulatory factor
MARKNVVGVLAPFLTGPFFRPLLNALSRQLRQSGYRALLVRWSPEQVARTGLASAQVDGWIVCVATAGLPDLARTGVPLVLVSAQAEEVSCPSVIADDFGGCYAATRHLLGHGHQRIGFMGGRTHYDVAQRFEGFQAALAEAGLPLDRALVLDTDTLSEQDGMLATRSLLASGASFSALVAASDLIARGALQALREAGRRVPEDVALVGFDDLDESQYIDPPLTTVRQQPDVAGRLAAKLMLDLLSGGPSDPVSVLLPTALMVRASCGCPIVRPVSPPVRSEGDWQALLVQDLLRLVFTPLPPEYIPQPQEVWPGAQTLVEAAAAALRRAELPDDAALQESARQVVLLLHDVQAMFNLGSLVRQSTLQAIGAPNLQGIERLDRLLEHFQQHMLRAYMAKHAERIFQFSHLAMTGYQAMSQMFSPQGLSDLTWLETTSVQWGLLSLWEQAESGRETLATRGRFRLEGTPLASMHRIDPANFPPLDGALGALLDDSSVRIAPISSPMRSWGLLVYAEPLIDSDYDSALLWTQHLGVVLERDAVLASIRTQQQTLREAYDRERSLAETVRALGCPIIPLMRGVLLVPLVGAIDEQRAQQIIEQVLASVSREQATSVLIDITGVPVVDTHVAGALIRTAQAVTLLGARVTLVGVRPEIAQSIVGLGVELLSLSTHPTLAAALERMGVTMKG